MKTKGKLKDELIAFVNSSKVVTKEDIKKFLETVYQERGLKPYDGSVYVGIMKGHWQSQNKLTIYKTECPNLPDNSLCIYLSGYGIGDKAMFYTIDGIEFNPLTREDEREAKIWQDLNDGIVGKTYN